MLDTSMAKFATGVGWTVGTMVGDGFGVGVYSNSWGWSLNGSTYMCETISLTRLD